MAVDMSDTDSVAFLSITPNLSVELTPREIEVLCRPWSSPTPADWTETDSGELNDKLRPLASKVLASIGALHGRAQAVVVSQAAFAVLASVGDHELVDPSSVRSGAGIFEGKAYSLVPDRSGHCLVARGVVECSLFGISVLIDRKAHCFLISDLTANANSKARVDAWLAGSSELPLVCETGPMMTQSAARW